MKKILSVPEMSCGHCKASILKALSANKSVGDISVDLESKKVTVETELTDQVLLKILDDIGFESEVLQ